MFEHLKEQHSLPWPQRIRYFLLASLVVASVFFGSLWLIAKTANYFGIELSFRPVAVTYDANEDGLLLNEITDESDPLSLTTESATASPQPSATADERPSSHQHEADDVNGHRPDRTEHSLPPESHSQTPAP